jgi:hypothetical protein
MAFAVFPAVVDQLKNVLKEGLKESYVTRECLHAQLARLKTELIIMMILVLAV